MLKRFTLTALFAITFAAGIASATPNTVAKKVSTGPVAQGLCPIAACF
jgi:hypothetical protein